MPDSYPIILLPLDGSAHSFEAANHAISLAGAFQSKRLIALHVSGIKRFADRLAASDEQKRRQIADETSLHVKEQAEKWFGEVQKKLVQSGNNTTEFQSEIIDSEESAGDAILRLAPLRRASIIVMAAKGSGEAKDSLFGSVAYRVLAYSPVPVLLVHGKP